MTIIELGALGELAGAVLLFASLIFVGLQVRQNTVVAKAQMYQARMDAIQEAQLAVAASAELSAIVAKSREVDTDAIASKFDPVELQRLRGVQLSNKLRCDNLFYQYKTGFIDEEFHKDVTERLIRESASLWSALGIGFVRRSFQQEVDRLAEASQR